MIANPIPWPNGNRCAVALSWDVDADSGLNYRYPDTADNLVASQSQVRFGPTVAMPRLIEVLRRLEMQQTFFVPGWVIDRYPAAVDLILENGHELALHGYLHERSNELSREDEAAVLARSIHAFVRRAGARPRGWRAPAFAFSRHSLELLIGAGFDYDSSLMGDEIPYVLEGTAGRLIELPVDWTFDDWPHYMHNRDFGYAMPIAAPERAMEVFRSAFDAAHRYGALMITVWHPFLSGRLARLHAIVELVEYMRETGGAWFARLDQICDHVQGMIDEQRWSPRIDTIPPYTCPVPEIVHRRKSDASS
ncbi:MAG TPA: polysaccharide deacetylase [Casimicrobiaceae bacterium]